MMPPSSIGTPDEFARTAPSHFYQTRNDVHAAAVSWGAIFAGAAAAAALSLILLILGTGLGLSSVSPWTGAGLGASAFGVSTILWVTLTQLLASGMGGYLAGRLRTRWVQVHTDEVYFRDTAHGFLAWAVASLTTAALLTSVIGSIVGTGVQAGASLAGGAAAVTATAVAPEANQEPLAYFVDALFRADSSASAPAASTANRTLMTTKVNEPSNPSVEVVRIFANGIQTGSLPADDAQYLGQLVAQRTGLTQAEAQKRVSDTFVRAQTKLHDAEVAAKEAADKARKASAYAALWLFISLLTGAFVASLTATYGGRRRDA